MQRPFKILGLLESGVEEQFQNFATCKQLKHPIKEPSQTSPLSIIPFKQRLVFGSLNLHCLLQIIPGNEY